MTDEFLDPLFANYFQRLGTPQQIFKRDYHGLADFVAVEEIDAEVTQTLDDILDVAKKAKPAA